MYQRTFQSRMLMTRLPSLLLASTVTLIVLAVAFATNVLADSKGTKLAPRNQQHSGKSALSKAGPLSKPNGQKVLAQYEVVFLLDRSHSMREILSEPIDNDFVCKLDWSKQQLNKFAKQSEHCLPSGFSIVAFNSNKIDRFDNCNVKTLPGVLESIIPAGGTDLVLPLIETAKERRTRKPLALFVLTDGYNVDPSSDYAKVRWAPQSALHDVSVTFICVSLPSSHAIHLQPLCDVIKNRLHPRNAATLPFDSLTKTGLFGAVINSLR